jgi:hypothetical protein
MQSRVCQALVTSLVLALGLVPSLSGAAAQQTAPAPAPAPPAPAEDPPAIVVPPSRPPEPQEPAKPAAPDPAAEKPVPSDSVRLTVVGCLRGRVLVSAKAAEADATSGIPPGIRFNLTGPKALMKDVKAYDRQLVQVTGLVLKGALQRQGSGLPLDGKGRIVLGPSPMSQGPMMGDPRSGTGAMSATMDISAVRRMDGTCSKD